MADTFRDNPALQRFELEVDGRLAFADYRRSPGLILLPHVEADPALRGTGAAGRLMEQIVAAATREGVKLRPICSYAAAWLCRHPDRNALLG